MNQMQLTTLGSHTFVKRNVSDHELMLEKNE